MTNVVQRIVSGRDVRLAVTKTVQDWSPSYLAEISRRSDRAWDALPRFRSYVSALELDRFDEDQIPSCVVVAPGTFDEPVKRGDGTYDAIWSVGVGCVVVGQDRENTFELVELYAAAVRTLLLQHPDMGGLAAGTEWISERYDELLFEDQRTIAAGVIQLGVEVRSVVSLEGYYPGHPDVPGFEPDPSSPPPDPTTVESVHVHTTGR